MSEAKRIADLEVELSSSLAKIAELAKRKTELEKMIRDHQDTTSQMAMGFAEKLKGATNERVEELESVLSDVLGAVPGDDDDFASFFDNFTDELEQRARRVLKGE